MFIYDVNTYIKEDNIIQSYCGDLPSILPGVGYEDTQAPFFLYDSDPGIYVPDLFFIYIETVCYYIYDTDADRGRHIRDRVIELLNVNDGIYSMPSSVYKPLWSLLGHASERPPREREGLYCFVVHFDMAYHTLTGP